VFCDIVNNTLPAAEVDRGDGYLAFLDNRPLFPGHVLVIAHEHRETIFDLPPDQTGPLFGAVQRIAHAVKTAMDADGVFIASNNGVSQSVPHLHVHVVPRRRRDGLRGFMWPRHSYADDDQAAAIAQRIKDSLP